MMSHLRAVKPIQIALALFILTLSGWARADSAAVLPVDIDVAFQDCAAFWTLTYALSKETGEDDLIAKAQSNANDIVKVYNLFVDGEAGAIIEPVLERQSVELGNDPSHYGRLDAKYSPACDAVNAFLSSY